MQYARPRTKTFARTLRRRMTRTELVLWRWLRSRRFAGVKFRRQHPIGKYVLDFYSDHLKLAVELDGRGHGGMLDAIRTAWLDTQGIAVIRFGNEEVREDPRCVADRLVWAIQRRRDALFGSPTAVDSDSSEG